MSGIHLSHVEHDLGLFGVERPAVFGFLRFRTEIKVAWGY
jgi:hypothetical protein